MRTFVEAEKLSCSTFYTILSKYGVSRGAQACRRQPKFIEVAQVRPPVASTSPSLTIKLQGGKHVVVRGAVDAAQLRLVVEVLRSC